MCARLPRRACLQTSLFSPAAALPLQHTSLACGKIAGRRSTISGLRILAGTRAVSASQRLRRVDSPYTRYGYRPPLVRSAYSCAVTTAGRSRPPTPLPFSSSSSSRGPHRRDAASSLLVGPGHRWATAPRAPLSRAPMGSGAGGIVVLAVCFAFVFSRDVDAVVLVSLDSWSLFWYRPLMPSTPRYRHLVSLGHGKPVHGMLQCHIPRAEPLHSTTSTPATLRHWNKPA